MGGSLGMAIRKKRLAHEVVGWSRKPATLRQAKASGAVTWGTTDLRKAVADADLVVLATPVDVMLPLGPRIARSMKPGSILTDVGSTKEAIVHALERARRRGVAFVGAHPLAGSERRGIRAVQKNLYDGSLCIVTTTRRTNRAALARVRRFWAAIADRVIMMDPARHDQLLAEVSHVPHVMAFCLMAATEPKALAIAPRSFLDGTRVAKSDPALWEAIFLTNRGQITAAMRRFERTWQQLRKHLAWSDRPALRRLLRAAKAKRDALD
ncbi:MAG: prephenate dehydrogenase [Candidatus Omnitrophica bacterium]|nr:prephenate dehydrogenase [Candidatus Omnitrophota bacterium]